MISFFHLFIKLFDDLWRDLFHATLSLGNIEVDTPWIFMDRGDRLAGDPLLNGHQGLVLLPLLVGHRDLGLLLEEVEHLALGAYSHGGQDEKCWRCTYGRTGGTP